MFGTRKKDPVAANGQPWGAPAGLPDAPEPASPREPDPAPGQPVSRPGLAFARSFGHLPHPREIEWSVRSAVILRPDGTEKFRQDDVTVPASWSEMATNVVASGYFYGGLDEPDREHSACQLVDRVVAQVAEWGERDGYFDGPDSAAAFLEDLRALCLHQHGSFNSPVWYNVGLSRSYGITGRADGYYWNTDGGPFDNSVDRCHDSYERPQVSACFIQSVDDNLESILGLATAEGMLFKYGSGSGSDLSTIRSCRETLSGGGTPSGPLSFMRIYDAVASVIKSGGKTRRAAKMQTLKVSHPDILDFIRAKPIEERKAADLEAAGWSGGMDGDAARTVLFQNANLSVRANDPFLSQADVREESHWLTEGVQGKVFNLGLTASQILDEVARAAWECGCPGMQYEDTINEWHTCPNSGRINSSNPCSEYVFLDDSACNLASLNLMKFRLADGTFDVDRFRAAVRVFITAQEILVDNASYPTAKIAENSHRFRTLGLGYANLGAYLMVSGLPYDSDEGRSLAGAITAIMTAEAYLVSSEIAEKCGGAFEGFAENCSAMLRVILKHRYQASFSFHGCESDDPAAELWGVAKSLWDRTHYRGLHSGFRNAQVTLLAPTGTIAFMMDCDTTGIEPDFALVKQKLLAGGGWLNYSNKSLREALARFIDPGTSGAPNEDLDDAVKWVESTGSLKGFDAAVGGGYFDSHPDAERRLAVFDCANPDPGYGRSIRPRAHLEMMAAVQPFLSGAISKTINLPADATVADVREAYLDGWRLGLKAVAIYRDGSKTTQPLAGIASTQSDAIRSNPDPAGWYESAFNSLRSIRSILGLRADWGEGWAADDVDPFVEVERAVSCLMAASRAFKPAGATRERLPADRMSWTHKFEVDGHEGYVTVGHYPDERPGEVFIRMAKEGSTIGGLMDSLGVSLSISLQYGVPIEAICRKLAFSRFEPHGRTKNPRIPLAKSLADYIGRLLISRYRPDLAEEYGIVGEPSEEESGTRLESAVIGPGERIEQSTVVAVGPLPAEGPPPIFRWQSDNPACRECGGATVRSGTCYRCLSCGASMGCS